MASLLSVTDPHSVRNPDGTYGPNRNTFPTSKAIRNRERRAAEQAAFAQRHKPARCTESRTPRFGSAEWCETQGDNLGESPDY